MILTDVGVKVKVHSFPIMVAASSLVPSFLSWAYEKGGNNKDEIEPKDRRERMSDGEPNHEPSEGWMWWKATHTMEQMVFLLGSCPLTDTSPPPFLVSWSSQKLSGDRLFRLHLLFVLN